MPIQWFPGHMHKARLQMQETLPKVDLVVEILDARIPFSSQNPMLAEMSQSKPCLRVLNKSDLADPEMTEVWLKYFREREGVEAWATTTEDRRSIGKLVSLIIRMLPDKKAEATITTMIAGIPNVGKSTLINTLAGRKVANTGNEPAVTKSQQRIKIGEGVTMLDTPGVMWPNVENIASGYRLATIGSIKETAMDYADVAFYIGDFLVERYYDRLAERYGLTERPDNALELVESIGRRRGCLGKAGTVDIDRASKILVTELRSGMLGKLTLESPEMMERETEETRERMARKQESQEANKKKRKAEFRQRNRDSPRGRKRRS